MRGGAVGLDADLLSAGYEAGTEWTVARVTPGLPASYLVECWGTEGGPPTRWGRPNFRSPDSVLAGGAGGKRITNCF